MNVSPKPQTEELHFRINPQHARQFIDHLNEQMSIAKKCRPKQVSRHAPNRYPSCTLI